MGNFPAILIAVTIAAGIGFRCINCRSDLGKIPLWSFGYRAFPLLDYFVTQSDMMRMLFDIRHEFCRLAIDCDLTHADVPHYGLLTKTKGADHECRRLVQSRDSHIADRHAGDASLIITPPVR